MTEVSSTPTNPFKKEIPTWGEAPTLWRRVPISTGELITEKKKKKNKIMEDERKRRK